MTTRILSQDGGLTSNAVNELWLQLPTVFADALAQESLPRHDRERLKRNYVRPRVGMNGQPALPHHLRSALEPYDLGEADARVLDFVLHKSVDRVLLLVGHCGTGKSSLLHFVEAAIDECLPTLGHRLLIVNALQLPDRGATREQLVELLRLEIEACADREAGELRSALLQASAELDNGYSRRALRAALACLKAATAHHAPPRITVVLDNLDHHESGLVSHALDLAREIVLSSNLGVIVCVRPGTEAAMDAMDINRAFFCDRIQIHIPSIPSWLNNIRGRVVNAYEDWVLATGQPATVGQREITSQDLSNAVESLASLLMRERHSSIDLLKLLEEVCADDARLLARLLKRLLQNHALPVGQLLGWAPRKDSHFSPLRGMLEAERLWYRGDPDLPNVLCFRDNSGTSRFLITFRLLQLIRSHALGCSSDKLFMLMSVFGYEREVVVNVLRQMYRASLITSEDGESFDSGARILKSFRLTSAGAFYVDRLFSSVDYLVSVVVDVPLKHEALAPDSPGGHPRDSFQNRLQSVIEYAREVSTREAKLLAELEAREASRLILRVVDVYRSAGGTLSERLLWALQSAATQAGAARAAATNPPLAQLTDAVVQLEHESNALRRRLDSLADRIRPQLAIVPELTFNDDGLEVVVIVKQLGVDLEIAVEVRSEVPLIRGIVSIVGGGKERAFAIGAGISPRSPSKGERGARSYTARMDELSPGPIVDRRNTDVSVLTAPANMQRVCLLDIAENGQHVMVRLTDLSPAGLREMQLGRDNVVVDELESWSREQLTQLGSAVLAGEDWSHMPRAIGHELARRCLSTDGMERLASQYQLFDTCVVRSRRTAIPWEFLALQPGRELLPLLAEQWRTFRWSGTSSSLRNHLAAPSEVGRLMTIGLPKEAGIHWRGAPPRNAKEFRGCAESFNTVHIVGHWNGRSLVLADGSFAISADVVRSFGLLGARNVVVTACNAAGADPPDNVAVALVETSDGDRTVWATMVPVTMDQASQLDVALGNWAHSTRRSLLEVFFKENPATVALGGLYARFGQNPS